MNSKRFSSLVAALWISASFGGIICSGDSASVKIDSRLEPCVDLLVINWDASWIGCDADATVVIFDNGEEVWRKTGVGEAEYALTGPARHDLVYKTIVDGIEQEETYSATIYSGWKYELDEDGNATVTATTQTAGDVKIPSEIDGHPVIGIGEGVFAGCDDITSATIPGNLLSSISELFPDSYDKITSITFTGAITEIPARAFQGCSGLTSVTIPDSVWNIGEGAFAGCSSLRRVEAAIGLKRLLDSDGMFADCSEDLEVVYHQTAEISDLTARQRRPWNGKVDITYTLTGNVMAGLSPDAEIVLSVTASNRLDGATYPAEASALSGDTGTAEGAHHVVWDLNAQGLELNSDDVTFAVAYAEPSQSLYCVIDLSAGANATSYPVSYLSDVPNGGWSDEYKTTKLVLRRIEPGCFIMGGQGNMSLTKSITLTKPYYIGIFEITQKQYELVMASNPSVYKGDCQPVDSVSYNMIRGTVEGAKWPASSGVDLSSFIGKLRAKTMLPGLDLPTEAQWEYACRSGTTTVYSYGDNANGEYMWYKSNSSSSTHDVGTRAPNQWGLYDMHGNVWEWCLDWWDEWVQDGLEQTDPIGPNMGAGRCYRSGGCKNTSTWTCSATRTYLDPSRTAGDGEGDVLGFRLVNNMVGGSSPNMAFCSADSAPVAVDSRNEPFTDLIVVTWDASWIGGDSGATVVITDNGTEVKRTTGSGEFEIVGDGRHELTYTTYVDGWAQDEVYSVTVFKGWAYEVDDDGDAILVDTAYKSGDVVIPSGIDGHAVIGIADGVFAGCDDITSATIPGNLLSSISKLFPDSYDKITSITLTGSITEISARTFQGCSSLTDLTIPETVTSIGERAFEGCEALTSVTIPDSVASIGEGVFNGCEGITAVTLPGALLGKGAPGFYEAEFRNLSSLDGNVPIVENSRAVVLDAAMTYADTIDEYTMYAYGTYMYFEGGITYSFLADYDDNSSVRVDETMVVNLAGFGSASQTGTISFPKSGWHWVELRGHNGFGPGARNYGSNEGFWWWTSNDSTRRRFVDSGDGSLFRIYAKCGILDIFPDAYDKITSITLTGVITEIPERAFQGCSSLTDFTIPETVTSIGERAFEGCEALTSVTIPDSAWNVGEGAFAGCSSLRRVEAAIGLKRLLDGDGMFADCPEDLEVVYHQTAEISDLTAKQRRPWNGKVDITYTLTGDVTAGFAPDNHPVLQIIATDNTTGETYVADASALSGDTGTAEGIHHVVWDLNAQGLELNSDDVAFTVAYAEPSQSLYCVIDLSAGANATSYPVSYLADMPEGGWTDEYKTTKLVLRRIEPGDIPTRDARITKPFYCGVFEVTQKQWELVMGSNPSQYQGDMRPVERISYNMIRGSSAGSQWPASSAVDGASFMGKIREKTGIEELDLTTEAQWEYACRAGTTSKYNNGGDSVDDMRAVGRYNGNTSDGKGGYSQQTTVGSYLPNAWGLYDMHGNVWEICLDWSGNTLSGDDPVGASSGSSRVARGGGWRNDAYASSSQNQGTIPASSASNDWGFRLANNIIGVSSPNLVLCSANSAAVSVDSRNEPVVDSVVVTWDASWIGGDSGATVVITDNGTEVKRTTGSGEFEIVGDGRHELTYTTYIDEVAQDEVYKTVVYKGKYIVHFDSNGGEGAMDDCEFVIDMPSALPQGAFTKDGCFLLGWSLTQDGEATLLDGDTITGIVASDGETVTLYAVWREVDEITCGLSAQYYDISSISDSGWYNQVNTYEKCIAYHAAMTPTLVANTATLGDTLCFGNSGNVTYDFHGKYANINTENFVLLLKGIIKCPESGTYNFKITHDDGCVAYIDGLAAYLRSYCASGTFSSSLFHGNHEIVIAIHEGGGGQQIKLEIKKPSDDNYNELQQSLLYRGAYAVRFDANGGNGSMPQRVYATDDDVILPDGVFTRDGWTLVGWAVEPEGPAIYPAEGSIEGGVEAANRQTVTLYARWAQNQYTVHFDANGGDGEMVDESFWLGIPDWLSSNVFTRVGYTFAGWATAAEGEVEYCDKVLVTNLTETADATANLYALWSPNQYQVRFNANGGDGWMENQTLTYDSAASLTSNPFTKVGYSFVGWATDYDGEKVYDDGEEVLNLATDKNAVIDLYALWRANAYSVIFDANGGEGGTSCEQDYNSPIVAPSVSRIGYTFAGWSPEVAETVPASNVTYTAQWEINKYTVTFDAKGGEGGTSCEQDYNSPIVAPSVSLIGHTFAGWLPEVAEIVPASNVTYAAQWEVNQYSVTFDANGGVGGLSAMQDYNSDIVPPVVSRFGCTFEGWAPSPDAKVPANDVSYFAQWKVWDITVDSAASSVKELYPDDYFRITNIVIGAEVDCLPAGFFDGCDALESLAFLSSETELGDNDLRTVGRLFECQPDGYWVVQGVLFGYKGDCPREIPELDSVKRVVDCALDGCKALEELNFTAESVLTTIGTNAFKHCTELQRMTLPPSLEEIGNEAFMGCSYIGNVIVPGSVKRVGDRAFKNCTGFTAAQIAYGVESLGEEAFYGDWRIGEVDIPSTVTNIGVNAFGGDSSIIRVGLRGDVRPAREIFSNYRSIREATVKEGDGEIVDGLFSGFSLLQDVHFLGNCPALANDGQLLYMNTPDKTVDYGGGNVINVLVTYVEQNSTGWDGIPGSHSLPQAWPLVGSYRRSIAWWNVPTYLCQFDANGGTLGVQDTYQYSERLITLPPEPVQTGYTFAGWWTQPIGGLRVTADTIFIEGVYTHLYAHWTKGHWVFLDPNGGTVVNDFVTYVEQSVYGVLPTPVRSGYSFGGWLYNGYKIEPETEINEKADHTLVAQWTANLYSVRYNANGGTGDMAEQGFVYGVEQELRKNVFACAGYEFIGWATNAVDAVGLEEETDAVVYADCEAVANLTAVADGWIELYAVWRESNVLPDPSNLDFHSSGDSNWELRYEGATVEKDGKTLRYATVWRSGNIGNNQKSVLVANTYGAGKIGFWWKVSCESFKSWKLDYLEFAIDGTAQEPWINGEKDWTYVEFEVESSGEHTLTWTYSKDEEGVGGEDCGWISAAVWTPKLESLGDYVNSPALEFASSGDAAWHGDENIGHDGIASLRSGAIGDDEVSTLEAEVDGAGRIGFWWKVSSEAYRTFKLDYASFWIDDVEQAWIGGEIGWTNVAFDVVGSGTHTLKWEYRKDAQDSSGEDCAWVDKVIWMPKQVSPVVNINTEKMEEPEVDEESGARTIAVKGDPLEDEAEIAALVEQVAVSVMMGAEQVYTTAGYNKTYDPTSNTIVITLKEPEVGAEEVAKVEDDATGVLADMSDEKVELATTEPEPTAEETAAGNTEAGALPVKAVKGLYYQASWGSDLSNLRQGEKVQATGETLYLGVIKQQGTQGFYKVTVSEQ